MERETKGKEDRNSNEFGIINSGLHGKMENMEGFLMEPIEVLRFIDTSGNRLSSRYVTLTESRKIIPPLNSVLSLHFFLLVVAFSWLLNFFFNKNVRTKIYKVGCYFSPRR